LIIVPCCVKSTNITSLWSQNTVAISLPADFTILNLFDHGDPGFFHSMLASSICRVWWWTHVLSPVTMHSRNLWRLTAHCWRNGVHKPSYAPCGLPIVLTATTAQTPGGTLTRGWSWQLFHVTDWCHVPVHWP
jgi:hypothetical protein